MNGEQQALKDQLLMTLSYFEPMGLEYIYIDLDKDFLMIYPELTIDDLKSTLTLLVKEKKIKKIKSQDGDKWIRIYPKKPLLKRLISLICR